MRFTSGWFKVWREAWDKDLSRNVYLWALWHALLHMAHWKESQIIWNGKQRKLPAGSVVFGIKEIAEKWGCSQRTISKWLHYLHDTQRIVLETCARGTLVTICNWEAYQANEDNACADRAQDVRTECELSRNKVGLREESTKKERKKSIAVPTETTLLWNYFQEKAKAKDIETEPRSAKTNKLCKSLVTIHGLDKAKGLIDAYFSDSSPFVKENAYSLGLLVSQQQTYLNRLAKPKQEAGWL